MRSISFACAGIGLVAVLLIVGAGCYIPIPFPRAKEDTAGQTPIREKGVNAGPSASLPAQQAISLPAFQSSIADRYRLRPDLRFIEAVARIHQFITGEASGSVEVRFADGRWEVIYDAKAVGALPEFPRFADGMGLLESWTRSCLAAHGMTLGNAVPQEKLEEIEHSLDGFSPYHLCEAGKQINAAWTQHGADARLLDAAARMHTLLAIQQLDSLGAFEAQQARALAFLALAKAAAGPSLARYEALLASELGYANHAKDTARTLELEDPVRLIVSLRYAQLRERADESSLNPLEKFLCMKALGTSSNTERVLDYANRLLADDATLDLPVCKAALASEAYVVLDVMSRALPAGATLALAQVTGQEVLPDGTKESQAKALRNLKKDPLELARDMDAYAVEADRAFTGPILLADAVSDFYRGCFVAGLAEQGIYLLYRSVDVPSAKSLAAYFGKFHGTFAEELGPWYLGLVELKEGARAPRANVEVLRRLSHIGTAGLIQAFGAMEGRYPYSRPENFECIEFFASRLDTRPQSRMELGDQMMEVLYDPAEMERLYVSALAEVSPASLSSAAWFASYNGDGGKLRELAAMKHATPYVRSTILEYQAQLDGENVKVLSGDHADLIRQFPDEWTVYESYYDYLFQRKRYDEARTIMRTWLGRDIETYDLQDIFAFCNVGETYFEQEKYQEALDAIEPVIDSAAFRVRALRARALAQLGRKAEAIDAGRFVVDRFRSTPLAVSILLRVYYTFGQDDEAKALILDNANILGYHDYRQHVWPVLIDIVGKDPARLRHIAVGLVESHLEGEGLRGLASAVGKIDQHKIAIELYRKEFEVNPNASSVLIYAYDHFDKLGQQEEGRKWIMANVPEKSRSLFAAEILLDKHHELLWDVIPNADANPHAEYVWLYRAAAAAQAGPQNDPHYQDLVAHLNAADASYYNELCRVLVGLSPEEKAYGIATNLDQVCETACYLGIMCAQQGRFEDAVRWFRTSVETRRFNNTEYHWAYDKLLLIAGENRSLKRLKDEGTTQY
ncbi:MAG: tetratricopeptide repeat protein [Candidatus Hydrogenedentes bacterium]|nr:tetratricopeptide repeat protein [Candidatus Hydrogenedentota bacterium]